MEKGKEVRSSEVPVPTTELPPAPRKNSNRKCTFVKLAFAAVPVAVVLYLVFGGDPDEGCDIFNGRWVWNPSGPLYNNGSCHFIDAADNCLTNGRPDTNYLFWRWKPYHCALPPFDPVSFMDAMRDKSWAMIGDSILRNQMQSMVCLASEVEEPVETYHDEAFKSRTFYFPKHNFTIATIWAPFLVKYETIEKRIQVHLDVFESVWTTDYHKYDYVVIAGGQWFLKAITVWENGQVIGCHNCEDKTMKEIGLNYPYQKALNRVFNFLTSSDHKPNIFFRTWNPDHFEYGEWYNGGVCNRTQPYSDGQFNGQATDHTMRKIELEEYEQAKRVASRRGIKMELLDIYHLSLLRPDGHPGPYRTFHPFDQDKSKKVQNDCLHWCLPGPVDAWNDLVMKILRTTGALPPLTSSYLEGIQDGELVFFQ